MSEPLNPRAVVIANNAGRILAAMEARGMPLSSDSILSAVKDAHETLYQAELACAKPAPVEMAKSFNEAA
jgi:hypothetical protein